jgi:hypothetical protein
MPSFGAVAFSAFFSSEQPAARTDTIAARLTATSDRFIPTISLLRTVSCIGVIMSATDA